MEIKRECEEHTLNEAKIKQYCSSLGYTYKIHQNNKVVIIETGLDSWELTAKQFVNSNIIVNRIKVKHYNRGGNKKGKMQYHLQTYADNVDQVFIKIIKGHDHEKNILNNIFALKNVFAELGLLKYA